MDESRNTQLVKDTYAAFGRGDIPAILAVLDDSIVWHAIKGAEGAAPQAGVRRGRASVEEFFSILASTTEFKVFEPREFIAQGDTVAVVGYYEVNVRTTGRSVASDWVMVFTLKEGRITQFREWTDSAQVVRAYAQAAAV
jgi:ketosteroid isomerase-like protein